MCFNLIASGDFTEKSDGTMRQLPSENDAETVNGSVYSDALGAIENCIQLSELFSRDTQKGARAFTSAMAGLMFSWSSCSKVPGQFSSDMRWQNSCIVQEGVSPCGRKCAQFSYSQMPQCVLSSRMVCISSGVKFSSMMLWGLNVRFGSSSICKLPRFPNFCAQVRDGQSCLA